ncbi:IQ calmodulin-binding motif-containing protein 1-like [Babylonia areolata]|uniref:IQ calmodulin-binding motif-containing protein 1-like n=1 Tax=Babylonia areolata TaxID=304850 RepID=UPI003FD12DC0
MTSPRPSSSDHRVLNLAKQLADTRERRMPAVLEKLKDILDTAPAGTPEGAQVRKEVWDYNILHMLIIIVRQDFSILPGEWRTAARLAMLISQVSRGLDLVGADRQELYEEQLPKAVSHLYLLAKHLQQHIINMTVSQETAKARTDLVVNFREVLDALIVLCNAHYFLCEEAMKSPWLLQLLMSDDPRTVNIVMAMMEKILRCDGKALSKVPEEGTHNLMDELVYKLTVHNDISIAASSVRCLLRFCESHKPLVEMLFSRYKGLRPLLRRWEGRGFERDLRQLYTLLESGSALRAQSQRKNEAASYIQAVWKGVLTRNRLRKADKAFSKFQRSYRLRKAEEDHKLLETRVQTELQRRLVANRQRLMIQLKEKHLQVLEILPADQIERYLMKEKSSAAVRIQTMWRGHRERSQLTRRQEVAQQVKAAIKIQRAVRQWMDRVERRQQKFPTHLKPSGLTDERRVQLQEVIARRRQEQPTARKTREEVEEIHKTAAAMLARHFATIRHSRKKQYQWENLLARLHTDSELLELAPALKDVTQKDVDMYSSRSLPVATKAKAQHSATLNHLQRPWWRRRQWEREDRDDLVIVDDDDDWDKEQFEDDLMLLMSTI